MSTTVPQKPPVKKTPATAVKIARAAPARSPTVKPGASTRPASLGKVVAASPKPVAKAGPAQTKAATAASAPATESREKTRKAKLVRDSFTMPELEYAALGEVKKACLKAGFEVKKSELLRIGVAMIRKMELTALKIAVAALAPLKPGRPRKEK
jgi:hypothetical protein